jgi:excisionase family DNA binding protein
MKGPNMPVATSRAALLTYDQAAELLGIQRTSVKQLVTRGRLHSLPAPDDGRRRLLARAEVEAYAREHVGKWSYPETAALLPSAVPAPAPVSAELVTAGLVSAGAAGALIAALRAESDAALKLLLIGALVGLALWLILEWRRQGKLTAAESRHLETLAKQAERKPDVFLEEFQQMLARAG